tara:strand:+ start:1600 stop:1776 length:177 start_codon:yes stop_codon:yes gene_type:complete
MIPLVHFIEVVTLGAAMFAAAFTLLAEGEEMRLRTTSLMLAFVVVSCSATAWRLLWLQ